MGSVSRMCCRGRISFMKRRDVLKGLSAGAGLLAMGAGGAAMAETTADTVFELRVYHAVEGRLDDLLARFRDHTVAIFARHGMVSVAYWTPLDEPLKGRTLFYILKHPSREAASANWAAFRADPEWVKVRTESEAKGKIVEKTESTFMKLTDFSPKI
jgi:hypothetical protein